MLAPLCNGGRSGLEPQSLVNSLGYLEIAWNLLNGQLQHVSAVEGQSDSWNISVEEVVLEFQDSLERLSVHRSYEEFTDGLDSMPLRFTCDDFPLKDFGKPLTSIEPLYPDLQNLMYQEFGVTESKHPYILAPHKKDFVKPRHAILMDVGAGGFFTSPKQLIDMYSPYLRFDAVYLFESEKVCIIPQEYSNIYDIHLHKMGTRVGSRDQSDVLTFLEHDSITNYGVSDFWEHAVCPARSVFTRTCMICFWPR